MSKWKWLKTVALATCIGSALTITAMAQTATKPLTIVVFTKNVTNPFWKSARVGADKAGKDLNVIIEHAAPTKPDRRSGGGSGRASFCKSARLTLSSALRMLELILCQALPTRQNSSRSQQLFFELHSVIATGPSSASMISAAVMSSAGRASA